MKNLKAYLSLIVCFLITNVGIIHSQNLPVPYSSYAIPIVDHTADDVNVPADDFPIGGMHFWTADLDEINTYKSDGLNVLYHDYYSYKYENNLYSIFGGDQNNPPKPQVAIFSKGIKSIPYLTNLMGGVYSGAFGSGAEEVWASNHQVLAGRGGNEEATELRYFLASNFGVLGSSTNTDNTFSYDIKHSWDGNARTGAAEINPVDGKSTMEWHIKADNPPVSGDYILFDVDQPFDPNNPYANFTLGTGYDGKKPERFKNIYCDFIYRVSEKDWQDACALQSNGLTEHDPLSEGTSLFTVEYYYQLEGSSILDRVPSQTGEYPNELTYSKQLVPIYPDGAHELADIKSFPNPNFASSREESRTPHTYVINRKVVPLGDLDANGRPITVDDIPTIGGKKIQKIICRVKRNKQIGIFVRGLRVRSQLAQEILSGSADQT
jgi:hypothetical protein